MSWEWSHTDQAYGAAHDNLHALPVETLREIYAEIQAAERRDFGGYDFSETKFNAALADAIRLNFVAETLADAIWDFAVEYRTCTNGGWKAHLCPFGCEKHQVPFD